MLAITGVPDVRASSTTYQNSQNMKVRANSDYVEVVIVLSLRLLLRALKHFLDETSLLSDWQFPSVIAGSNPFRLQSPRALRHIFDK